MPYTYTALCYAEAEDEGLSASAVEKLSKLKVFQHLRERHKTQQNRVYSSLTSLGLHYISVRCQAMQLPSCHTCNTQYRLYHLQQHAAHMFAHA